MTEQDSLARVLHADDLAHGRVGLSFEDVDPGVRDWYLDNADAALAWFAEHRGPRVVSTVEELDALPEGSVVLDHEGEAWQRVADQRWVCTSGDSSRLHWSDPDERVFTLLHTPTTESEER